MSESHHDLADLLGDGPDDLDSEPPTDSHNIRDLHAQHAIITHASQIKRGERRTEKLASAIGHVHGIATEARDTGTRIETKIDTAISTLKLVGAVLVAAFGLASGLAAVLGYALSHFTLH